MSTDSVPSPVPGSMLLVLPVPFRWSGDNLLFEFQACNGLNRWADNFSSVVAMAPVMPEDLAAADKTIVWQEVSDVVNPRVHCIPLPWAYVLPDFIREYSAARRQLAYEIRRAEYLQFAIGGLVGDWAALAALEAHKQGRSFAIHTDRVESELLRRLAQGRSGPRAWKMSLEAALMERYHRSIIRHCSAGLWHGQECYTAYSPYCANNHLVHDVHTKPSDAISAAQLQDKLDEISRAAELRIVYAGRMAQMKAPLEWLKAIARARDRGVALRATWYGDGELRTQMQSEVSLLKLDNVVSLNGFVASRPLLLQGLREAHLMLFTHVTPESPRCLLESLICGTPIVGYDNPFARDLTENVGGGTFVPLHDFQALGTKIAELAAQRDHLRHLVKDAAANGRRFNDVDLFRERSLIIKRAEAQENIVRAAGSYHTSVDNSRSN